MEWKSEKQKDSELKEKSNELSKVFGLSKPWPLKDVIQKLIDASEILLLEKDYDGHGWEEISHCVDEAKQYIEKINQHLNK